MKFFTMLSLLISGTSFASTWNGKVFQVQDRTEIGFSDLVGLAQENRIVVMGENHITPAVQNAEAHIVRETMSKLGRKFYLAWEFLSVSQQVIVDRLLSQVQNGELTYESFIDKTLGNKKNYTYIPVLRSVLDLGGEVKGINLTREEKAPVTKGGIKAADPKLIPLGYEIGGADYLERFAKQMDGHVPAEKVANYFDAQCLTDDVMAYSTLSISEDEKIFVVAGHFHTDFFDGVVHRLWRRSPYETKLVIRIIDAAEFKEDELLDQLRDQKYGPVADLVYIVNEPNSEKYSKRKSGRN